jgi:hypothetical protein
MPGCGQADYGCLYRIHCSTILFAPQQQPSSRKQPAGFFDLWRVTGRNYGMNNDVRIDGWIDLTCFFAIEITKKRHNSRKRRESGMQAAEESNDRDAPPA